jgi:diaminohydroxyphosphoribosylaminopyrimidine deaminase / 5-amino-6-(5-phosphoribosylamino)uracil reductase
MMAPDCGTEGGADCGDDRAWMSRAVRLAALGRGFVEPNPTVGCVLVRDGELIGEGYHRRFGGPHAEVDALASLGDPESARGATAYVTLEPCCHTGKTPPCSDALIAAGVSRVVMAIRDPFPKVNGGGVTRLRAAGIRVDIGVGAIEATKLCASYLKRVHTGRPWVIAKWAMTLDGRIATVAGDSQWISGEVSRGEVHRLRGLVDGIVVGGGTAAADDPTLTARPPGPRTAVRIVVAGKRLPGAESRLVKTIDQAPLLVVVPRGADEAALRPLEKAGAEILRCAEVDPIAMVGQMLDELGKRHMTNLLVEGGGGLLGSFLAADQIDEVHAYVATKLVGGAAAPGPVAGAGLARLIDSPDFELDEVRRFDDDVRIVARRRVVAAGVEA